MHSGVRFQLAEDSSEIEDRKREAYATALGEALDDSSPSVRIAAAEALLVSFEQQLGLGRRALKTLGEVVQDDRPRVALQAARALALQGERSRPLIPVMKQVVEKNRAKAGSSRP